MKIVMIMIIKIIVIKIGIVVIIMEEILMVVFVKLKNRLDQYGLKIGMEKKRKKEIIIKRNKSG